MPLTADIDVDFFNLIMVKMDRLDEKLTALQAKVDNLERGVGVVGRVLARFLGEAAAADQGADAAANQEAEMAE